MKKYIFLLFSFYSICFANTLNNDNRLHFKDFAIIPILHEGRIKPLDTLARSYLTNISGKEQTTNLSAIAWIAELLFDKQAAYKRFIFNIPNPEVVTALNLHLRPKHLYSFLEVSTAFTLNAQLLQVLHTTNDNERTLAQCQLMDLFIKYSWYFDISNSFTAILPTLMINNPNLASQLSIKLNHQISYFDLLNHQDNLIEALKSLHTTNSNNMTKTEQDLITFAKKLQSVLHSKTTHTVRIIPPDKISNETWETPWNIARYKSSKKHIECLYSWQQLATAYTKQDPVAWNNISHGIKQNSLTKLTTNQTTRIKMECYYNKLNLFEWSKYIYLLIFIVNLICMLLNTNIFIQVRKIMHCALLIGSLLHGIGICIRSYIMMRPPVATLYESILFVGYIAVVFTLILEIKRKDYSGIFIGSIVGTLLQYIGTRYATDGDTMGMLSAVLNTNFWLTTHVLTISVGYSSCFITGGFGHFYLLTKLLNSKNTLRLDTILKNMLAMGLIALFFSLLGTILGGIWADQSWGRFWGWDPKENGAMLIVLWLTLLLHGRIAKLLSPAIFAVGMILTNIVVVLAWFGVNLLNVGLHSYGFTQNVGINIVTFCGIEILFIIMILICSHIKQQSSFWKNTQPKNTTA